ncbi:MAG: NIPSNAP family protein [Pigmentiphaga sp.]
MIVDQRTYTVQIGAVRGFLELYAAEGRAVQIEHLGPPVGYYSTEVGDVNQIVHLWQYADLADRDRRRAALESDPRWLAYRRKAGAAGHVVKQFNTILKVVDFDAFTPAETR